MSKVKLKDITLNITDGKHGDCKGEDNSGYYFISCKDVIDGTIHYESARQITKDDFLETDKRTNLAPNDILITNSGTIGRMALVKDLPETRRTTFQKSVAIVKPKTDRVIPSYLYYLLKSRVTDFVNSSNGAAQKNLLLSTMRDFDLDIQDSFFIQNRIATILSRYDDLIENYQKQIKLLEETAQRLYKEWFVDFRFPDYENTNFVNGVPEGWENTCIGNLLIKLESGSRPKGGIDATIKDGVASVGAENVIGLGQYNFTSEKMVTYEYFDNAKKGIIGDKDILVYKDGAYVGRTSLFQDGFPHNKAMVNEHVFLLHASNDAIQYFMFFTLYQKSYYDKMQKLNKNAAQPGINRDSVKSLNLLLPTEDLIFKFDTLISPMMKYLFCAANQIHSLTEARDHLLLQLMKNKVKL